MGIAGTTFIQTTFMQTIFIHTIFIQTTFIQTIFIQTIFIQTTLIQTIFTQTTFTHTTFTQTTFTQTTFIQTIFIQTNFHLICDVAHSMPAAFISQTFPGTQIRLGLSRSQGQWRNRSMSPRDGRQSCVSQHYRGIQSKL